MSFYKQRLKSVFKPALKEKIFFLHFEKCGGTSLKDAIQIEYADYQLTDIRKCHHLNHRASLKASTDCRLSKFEYRDYILNYLLADDRNLFVRGHFRINADLFEAYKMEWHFITLLREPTERFISHYFFNRFKSGGHDKIGDISLSDYLSTPRAKEYGQDYVTNIIGKADPLAPVSLTSQDVDAAIDILQEFSIVGILEQSDQFVQQFKEKFGRALQLQRKNKNPVSKQKQIQTICERDLEQIKALCEKNYLIYNKFKANIK